MHAHANMHVCKQACMQGYERLGFTREGNATVYREWCPAAAAAQLIGEFNNWSGAWMERDEFGVWKVVLPDGEGLASCMISPMLTSSSPRSVWL